VLFAEPDRTRYDLSFRLLGFPVRVHPWFWLATLIFGADLFNPDRPEFILAWIGIAFVSFLVHELGHAAMYRAFGVPAHVILYALGGLAVPWDDLRGRWKRVAVSLAGPGAGFLLAAAVWASDEATGWAATNQLTRFAYLELLFINIAWGVVNLLPVFPLDGGRVSQEVCQHLIRRGGTRVALQISVAVAGAVAVYSAACLLRVPPLMEFLHTMPWWFPAGGIWTLVLFGVLAYQSYLLAQQLTWADGHWDR
jgi:Zn-dependent protease